MYFGGLNRSCTRRAGIRDWPGSRGKGAAVVRCREARGDGRGRDEVIGLPVEVDLGGARGVVRDPGDRGADAPDAGFQAARAGADHRPPVLPEPARPGLSVHAPERLTGAHVPPERAGHPGELPARPRVDGLEAARPGSHAHRGRRGAREDRRGLVHRLGAVQQGDRRADLDRVPRQHPGAMEERPQAFFQHGRGDRGFHVPP